MIQKITLKTLQKSTAQQVFDHVAEHLLTQKERAFDSDNGACVYRLDHLKCAAGSIIADDEYSSKMEEKVWPELVRENLVPPHHADIITALQGVHDNWSVSQWSKFLRKVAADFDLKDDVVTKHVELELGL